MKSPVKNKKKKKYAYAVMEEKPANGSDIRRMEKDSSTELDDALHKLKSSREMRGGPGLQKPSFLLNFTGV